MVALSENAAVVLVSVPAIVLYGVYCIVKVLKGQDD